MKFGIDSLCEEVAYAAGASIKVRHDLFMADTKCTPIEALFYAAFVARAELSILDLPLARNAHGMTAEEAVERLKKCDIGCIGIFPQCQFPGWRVDFLLGIRDDVDSFKWLIVECDGHDFHERTKEQAAKDRSRDRDFQAKGYTVFRFTGSELYRSPFGKAGEAYKWLLQQVAPYAPYVL